MTGLDVLQRLAIPTPPVAFGGGRDMPRFLFALARDLSTSTRVALETGAVDDLIHQIDRAEPWPPLGSGVHVAAEVAAHLVDQHRAVIQQRSAPEQN
jgi:hypothetical protein